MEGFDITVTEGEKLNTALGVSDERHDEFANGIGEELIREYFEEDVPLATQVKKTVDWCNTPSEIAYFTYSLGAAIKNGEHMMKIHMMQQLMGQ